MLKSRREHQETSRILSEYVLITHSHNEFTDTKMYKVTSNLVNRTTARLDRLWAKQEARRQENKRRLSDERNAKRGPEPRKKKSLPQDPNAPERVYGIYKFDEPHIVNKYLEVRETGSKGLGPFTRAPDIPAGTLLLQEPVLVFVRSSRKIEENSELQEDVVRQAVEKLSTEDRRKFVTLSHHGAANTLWERASHNSFDIDNGRAVLFWMSMINHSCMSNCQFDSTSSGSGKRIVGELRAIVPLPARGTEITMAYMDKMALQPFSEEFHTTASYNEYIEQTWGFRCIGEACQKPGSTDRDFRELRRLEKVIDFQGRSGLHVSNIACRQTVEADLERFTSLLRRYRLMQRLFSATYGAAQFYSNGTDDLARSHAFKWSIQALLVANASWGIEHLDNIEDESKMRNIEERLAPEPRFLSTRTAPARQITSLVKTQIPNRVFKKFYGNLYFRGGPDISDIPRALYG